MSIIKKHYFMITATLTLMHIREGVAVGDAKEEDVTMYQPRLNTVISHSRKEFGVDHWAMANDAAQLQFRQKSKDESGIINDIVIDNVFYMGLMTPEEYQLRSERNMPGSPSNKVNDLVQAVAQKAGQKPKS